MLLEVRRVFFRSRDGFTALTQLLCGSGGFIRPRLGQLGDPVRLADMDLVSVPFRANTTAGEGLERLGARQIVGLSQRAKNSLGQRRSEEHTSELQSRGHLVCRILLEKKNKTKI